MDVGKFINTNSNYSPKFQIQHSIIGVIKKIAGLDLTLNDFVVEYPENEQFGDYATNVALVLSGRVKQPAIALAQKIVKELSSNIAFKKLFKAQVKKPGFINISINNKWFISNIKRVIRDSNEFGKLQATQAKKIMIEYAHPNTHKLFHIGHLRNITNGEAIARILQAVGCKVIRANYQGDVGLHIAKCLWAIKKWQTDLDSLKTLDEKIEFLGKAYVEGNRACENDENAKKEISKINRQIYDQDSEIKDLWQVTRQWSLDYFERIYKRVDTRFNRYYLESEVAEKGKKIVLDNIKKRIFEKSKGAIIFPGSKYGLHDRVFITGEANPTYEAKDMELGRLQFEEYNPDLIIHNVGPEQAGYFKVLFKALEKVFPKTKDKEFHLAYGSVKLKKGKMSSRQGNVITGEWLLDKTKQKIQKAFPEIDDKTAESIAVGAVKYSFLKVGPSTDVAFDFEESISLQGNSGPYLQYTYARTQSILRKSQISQPKDGQANLKSQKNSHCSSVFVDCFPNSEEQAILRWIYRFPEVVLESAKSLSPNLIGNFLYELAQKYNTFYNKHRVIGNDLRLGLTMATAKIIKNGLYLLGIKAPVKM